VDLMAIQPQPEYQRASNPYRQELGIGPEQRVLLYSGSMNKKQGLELLVEAIERLADVADLVWLLAGEGPNKAELAAATAGMANVRLLPLQPADLVLPSKLLGILASGRPLVASSPATSELGQIAELAGLRVEPEDGAGFAGALRQLLVDGVRRQRLGQEARQLAEQRYGSEAVLGQLERELEALQPG
jgi:colanic acid biosynthesis glycosyl transferase WcaI